MHHRFSFVVGSVVGAALTAMAMAASSTSYAQRPTRPETLYIGLWEGIDAVDGGNSLRSILPDGGGLKVIGRDTWHGPCGYGDPAVGISSVTVTGDSLKGTLELDCQAGETAEIGDRFFKVLYTFDPATQTLTETFLDPDTEEPLGRPPIVFFRQSPPLTP
jgi:hypothetical protein